METPRPSLLAVSLLALGLWTGTVAAQAPADSQLAIAFDASIAPTFLDPAETPGIGTPFVFLYALHDALLKPLPGNNMAPCLAESWKESPDGLVYEFKLREGLKFHNGDPFTAEDVKFSFHRYRGASAKLLHDRVKSVDVVDPARVRFVLHAPWPDFMVFYATPATGAAWIVPKKYLEKVGEEGFKRQPIGLGPYRFVRANPGIEMVLEANEQYWRKKPSIKRVVIKGVPDRTTRLTMLKTGEADIGYLMVGVEAATIKADPKLRLARTIPPAVWYVEFPEQWNPKSPWADRRVRLAANMALDRQAINEAERLGYSRLTGSIIPSVMDFALRIEPHPYDPTHAKRLLAVAGAASLPCDINGSAEMGIGVAADLHLAVSSPEIVLPGTIPVTSTAEMVVTKVAGHKYLDDLIKRPFHFENGLLYLSDGAGLGIEVDEAKIAKYRIG